MALKVIAEAEFESEVLRSEVPVLVDFFATWCQPCKQLAPEVEAVAQELGDKLKVVKVDIDQSPRLASMLRIQSVPTIIVFHQGRPAAAEQGVVTRKRLRELVEPFLPRAQGAVKVAELAMLMQERGAVAVDTRDSRSYARAHIPGAKNIPLEEVSGRLAELMMLGLAVLYCRSGDKAQELSEMLAKDDVNLPFLEGGFLTWEADMQPIERS